jgi:predicted ester cyclase
MPEPVDRDSLLEFIKDFYAAFPDQTHVVDDVIAEGNKVAGRVTAQATHKGAFEGIAATGRKVTYAHLHIARIADGEFEESWVLEDNLGLMRQLGMELRPAEATE